MSCDKFVAHVFSGNDPLVDDSSFASMKCQIRSLRSYKCKVFTSRSKMNLEYGQHLNYCTQNDQTVAFKCDICAFTFRTSSERNIHILNHFQKINCSICDETLIQLGNIWYTIREHSDHNVNKIETNSNDDGSESNFDDALKSEVDPIYNEQTELQHEHSSTVTDDNPVTPETGDSINYQTESVRIPNYIEHKPLNEITDELEENTNSQDTIPRENFETNEDDNVVPKVKTKGQCHICMKKIVCSTSLRYHMNLHLGLKPFQCDLCDKAFADKRNLSKHKRLQSHEESTCDICGRKFSRKSNLILHMNSHMKLRPHKCNICHKSFSDKRNYDTHRKKHTNNEDVVDVMGEDDSLEIFESIELDKFTLTLKQIKSLTCPICSRKFSTQAGLKGHIKLHRNPMFQCKPCAISFPTLEKFHAHKSSVHKSAERKEATTEYSIVNFGDAVNMAARVSENTDWLCEYCNTDFKLEINLAKHLHKDHDDKKPEHTCNICAEKFSSLSDLLAHIRAHPESSQYKCTFDGCEHGFAYKANLSTHLGKHRLIKGHIKRKTQDDVRQSQMQHAAHRLGGSNEKNNGTPDEDTICTICSKKYPNRTVLQCHIQAEHTNERIKCLVEECDKIFKRKSGLIYHVRIHHPELVRKCGTCKKVFYSDAKLAEHQQRHNASESGSFPCSSCSKTFVKKHDLLKHMISHEKEAKCNICNKKFGSVKGMVAHRERHGKKRSLTCRFPDCNMTFEDRREFMQHASQHPESGKKRYICPHCGKALSSLKGHMNTHTGAKPYECSVCQKKFATSSSFGRHKLIHTGQKPYVCDVEGCTQAYRDSIDLKRHKFSAHKIYTKKHICSICSKVFPERKLLRNHIVKVHDKVDHVSVPQIN